MFKKKVTRSWKMHRSSSMPLPPPDFVRINKLAIKMHAANFASIKDFRKSVDFRQKRKIGQKTRKIHLPPIDFVYGVPNRPPTPIKEVINNDYGNKAEKLIRQEYSNFIKNKTKKFSKPPKVIPRYINPKVEEMKKKEEEKKANDLDIPIEEEEKKDEKPLYKLKMFQNVPSKIVEGIKQFKTYHPYKKKEKIEDNCCVDKGKVHEEIKEKEKITENVVNA